jgi:hypothetical protein
VLKLHYLPTVWSSTVELVVVGWSVLVDVIDGVDIEPTVWSSTVELVATVPDGTSTVGANSQSTSIMSSTQEYLNTSDAENTASTQNTTMSPSTVDTPPVSTHISTTGTSQNTLTSTWLKLLVLL